MDEIWAIVLIVVVAAAVFLLVRWTAARRAVGLARRRQDRQGPTGE